MQNNESSLNRYYGSAKVIIALSVTGRLTLFFTMGNSTSTTLIHF